MIFSFRHPKRRAKLDAAQDTVKKLQEAISISSGSIAPSAPKEGSLWVDEPNNRMMVYTEGKWVQMSGDSELRRITNKTIVATRPISAPPQVVTNSTGGIEPPRIKNVLYFTDDPIECFDMTPKTPCGSEGMIHVGHLARVSANKFGIPVMGP